MAWIFFAPLITLPASAALYAAHFALVGDRASLVITLGCSGFALALTLMVRDSTRSPRLFRRVRSACPAFILPAPISGWQFGRTPDDAHLLTAVVCVLLGTLALLPALHALARNPEAL